MYLEVNVVIRVAEYGDIKLFKHLTVFCCERTQKLKEV